MRSVLHMSVTGLVRPAPGRLVWGSVLRSVLAGAILATVFPGTPAAAAEPVVDGLNEVRAEAGIAPLEIAPALHRVAAWRARRIARGRADRGVTSVARLATRIDEEGYEAYRWTEKSLVGPPDSGRFLAAWRDGDPRGFRRTLLGDWEEVGVAAEAGPDGPVHVVIFGLSQATVLARRAAPLADLEAVRRELLGLVNRVRSDSGVPPVEPSAALDAAAQLHAEDMAARSYYAHRSPEGKTILHRSRAAGYRPAFSAENIARGLFRPSEVFDRWMLSTDHRRNILHPGARDLGIGVALGEGADELEAVWVMALGRRITDTTMPKGARR